MFKVGDRLVCISVINKGYVCSPVIGDEYEVLEGMPGIDWIRLRHIKTNDVGSYKSYDFKLSNDKNMSLKQKVANLFLSEPNKSRQATGITDANNQLTTEGMEVFLNYLLEKSAGDFDANVVLPLAKKLEEEKK